MAECERIHGCSFVKGLSENPEKNRKQLGFITEFCYGDKIDCCKRLKVLAAVKDPAKVPSNLMPNGKPLPGTKADWSDQVKELVH